MRTFELTVHGTVTAATEEEARSLAISLSVDRPGIDATVAWFDVVVDEQICEDCWAYIDRDSQVCEDCERGAAGTGVAT